MRVSECTVLLKKAIRNLSMGIRQGDGPKATMSLHSISECVDKMREALLHDDTATRNDIENAALALVQAVAIISK